MQDLYEEPFTMHKEVVCVLVLLQQCKDFVKNLKNVQVAIMDVHEWTMWYKGAPLDLGKKMKPKE